MSNILKDVPTLIQLKPVDYDINPNALEKWVTQFLDCRKENNNCFHFSYLYLGSTCNNGGINFQAVLNVVLKIRSSDLVIKNARIDFPDKYLPQAKEQCEFLKTGVKFFEELKKPPAFVGQKVEDVLAAIKNVIPSGCFCTQPMRDHKWRNALSAIHFAFHKKSETC